MALQMFVQPRGGENIAAGIRDFGRAVGAGLETRIANAKIEKEQGKASEAMYKVYGLADMPEDKGGIPKEIWDTWNPREKFGHIQGIVRSKVLEQESARIEAIKAQTEAMRQSTEMQKAQMRSTQAFPAALAAALTTATTTPVMPEAPTTVMPVGESGMLLNTTPSWGADMGTFMKDQPLQSAPSRQAMIGGAPKVRPIEMMNAGTPMRPTSFLEQISGVMRSAPGLQPADALNAVQQAQVMRGEVPGMSAAMHAAMAAGLQPSAATVKLPGGAEMKFDTTAQQNLNERTTAWGVAPTPKLASDFTEYMAPIAEAIPLFDRLIELGNQGNGTWKMPLSDIREKAKALSDAAQASMRKSLTGGGNPSDKDAERLQAMIPNPTEYFSNKGIVALKEMRDLLIRNAGIRAKSYRIQNYTDPFNLAPNGGGESAQVYTNQAEAESSAKSGQKVKFYRTNPETGLPEVVVGTKE